MNALVVKCLPGSDLNVIDGSIHVSSRQNVWLLRRAMLSPPSKTPGSMTDASKRRSDDAAPSTAPCLKQRPLAPQASGKHSDDRFPPGISSLTERGKTVLRYGKFAKADLTYMLKWPMICQRKRAHTALGLSPRRTGQIYMRSFVILAVT